MLQDGRFNILAYRQLAGVAVGVNRGKLKGSAEVKFSKDVM